MKIEHTLKREGGTQILMGETNYHFAPLPDGAHVADVADREHVKRFLSIPEGFQLYDPAGEAPKAASSVEVLLGADGFEAAYTIGGVDYQLGDVVAKAHVASGLSTSEWNDLAEDTRAGMIEEELDKLANVAPPTEREELVAQYEEKFGKKPHPNMGIDKLREKLADE